MNVYDHIAGYYSAKGKLRTAVDILQDINNSQGSEMQEITEFWTKQRDQAQKDLKVFEEYLLNEYKNELK